MNKDEIKKEGETRHEEGKETHSKADNKQGKVEQAKLDINDTEEKFEKKSKETTKLVKDEKKEGQDNCVDKSDEKDDNDIEEEKAKEYSEEEKVNMRFFAYGFIGIIAFVIISMGVIGTYRVYKKVAEDTFTVTVAKILRLPAGKVSNETILYSDFMKDLSALKTYRNFITKEAQASGQEVNITDDQLQQDALFRLIDNALVNVLISTYNVTSTESDVDIAKNEVLGQFKDVKEAESKIKEMFGWDIETYVDRIIKPGVIKSSLQNKIQDIAKERAGEVYKKVKDGGDFAELAKEYGSDSTRDTGGDLDWFGKGDMVKEFEEVVLSLKKGELASSTVMTNFGYHIIKVTDTKKEKVKDDQGVETEVDKYRASHILFPFDLNYYLDKQARITRFKLYLPISDPMETVLGIDNASTATSTK